MQTDKSQAILDSHKRWLDGEENAARADLTGANLTGADLTGADLTHADLPSYSIVPQEGAFVAYKKAQDEILVLEIPSDAARTSSLIGRKCRASHCRVLRAETIDGEQARQKGWKTHGRGRGVETMYRVGEIVKADSFDPDPRIECSHGIHFFITRKEAEEF